MQQTIHNYTIPYLYKDLLSYQNLNEISIDLVILETLNVCLTNMSNLQKYFADKATPRPLFFPPSPLFIVHSPRFGLATFAKLLARFLAGQLPITPKLNSPLC